MTTRATSKEPTIELLRGPITYQSAIANDQIIIHEATYVASNAALDAQLWKARDAIAAITKQHLGLGRDHVCVVAPTCQWLRGSFNVCIPVELQSGSLSRKLMFRCAMPYKLAEAHYPATVDEKVACEVGTYAWMQEEFHHIRPRFLPHRLRYKEEELLCQFWSEGASQVVQTKVGEHQNYKQELQRLFE